MSFSYKIIDELCDERINNKNFCIGIFVALDYFYRKYDLSLKKDFLVEKREIFKKRLMLLKEEDIKALSLKSIKSSHNSLRGFLAGMFICCGILSDPKKSYNLEYINNNLDDARNIEKILGKFNIKANIVKRKNYFVDYIHEAELISKFLRLIKVNKCLMEFENIRIFKELRSDANRAVNFETANLNKTVKASLEVVSDIKYIIDTVGLDYLPNALKNVAFYRLKYRHVPLKELGEKFYPALSKSTMHYKLKSIRIIAKELKKREEIKKRDNSE